MYERVIVAVDTSDHASHVTETGIALARTLEADIEVVNVFERPLLDVLRSGSDRERITAERTELLTTLEATAEAAGLSASSRLLEGKPASQVVQLAGNYPNSILVIGREGRESISRRLLGGVTETVLGTSPVPVLVDPAAATDRGPFDLDRILVPTDGSENATLAYPHAGALADRTAASLHVLAVLDLQQAGGVFNAGGLPDDFVDSLEAKRDETVAAAVTDLEAMTSDVDIETVGRKTTNFDGVSGAIVDYARDRDVDLVVMGSHGRSNLRNQLLGSVTSTLLNTMDRPVLVVPRSSRTEETNA